jgi:hypothetical protein
VLKIQERKVPSCQRILQKRQQETKYGRKYFKIF